MLWTLLFLPLSTPCLVIRSTATTTTPEPTCDCPYHLIDSTNIMEHVNTIPIISNLTNYAVSKPIVKLDDCMTTLYCENDNSLVVFDAENYDYFGLYQADVICDKYTKKSMVFGEVVTEYTEFYAICVGPPCPCPWTPLAPSNFDQLLSGKEAYKVLPFEFWSEVSSYDLGPDNCPTNIACPDGWTGGMVYTDWFHDLFSPPMSGAKCNPETGRWSISVHTGRYMYPYCTDWPRKCESMPFYLEMNYSYTAAMDNANEVWLNSIKASTFYPADYKWDEKKCVTEFTCSEADQHLVILADAVTVVTKVRRVTVNIPTHQRWIIKLEDGKYAFDGIAATLSAICMEN